MLEEPLESNNNREEDGDAVGVVGASPSVAANGAASPADLPVGPLPSVPCFGTNNLKALWGMFLLNTVFAISQMVGSQIANSLSMFSDSGSMLVDSLVYLINILMERTKTKYGPDASKLWEVYVSFLSVSLLVTVTSIAIADAATRLAQNRAPDEEPESVDGRIVVGFSLGNLFIDILMCGNYCYQMRHRRRANLKEQVITEAKEQLNMVAAYVHLFADTLRTLTGLIAGILEQAPGADALHIDAVATFVVCSLILCAACFVLYEGCLQYRAYKDSVANDEARVPGIGDGEYTRFRSVSSVSSMTTSQTVEMGRLGSGSISTNGQIV